MTKIEPGVLCYVRYANPEYVDPDLRHLNGCAVVEVVAYQGREMFRRDGHFYDFWSVKHRGGGPLMEVVENLLHPIPPDELEQLTETQKPKEDAPA